MLKDAETVEMRVPRQAQRPPSDGRSGAVHLAWFLGGTLYAFLVPYLLADRLGLAPSWYYLLYFVAVAALLGAYVKTTSVDWQGAWRRSWRLSLVLGVAIAAFLVLNVLSEPATPGPQGPALGFEVLWRGLAYGVMDSLLLTVFPLLVATALLRNRFGSVPRRIGLAALTLVLSLVITASYHAGYAQYRAHGMARNGLGGPLLGNTVISLPAAIATNPIGSVVAHSAMHIAAVVHTYETDIFLPPKTQATPGR